MKRRNFIKNTGVLSAAGLVTPGVLSGFNINSSLGQNEKLNIGVIGCNGMGWSNMRSMLKMEDVLMISVCDVDQNAINRRLEDYGELRANKPKVYGDYRELLEKSDVDAVIIGTPDHWHCKMMVDAVRSGKHVYVEKPVANTIEESYLMTAAAEQTGKCVQTGQWQRSGIHYREARDFVQSGQLGTIRLVKVWAYQGWMKPIPIIADSEVPEGVDYKMWLGMAPDRPFNQNRFHFNFRWFWDYAGGLMTDWGVHEIDIALWVMDAVTPRSVVASGGKLAYPDDASETPDTLQAIFEYGDFNMLWEHATGIDNGPYDRTEGIAFIGNDATLVVNRGGYEIMVENRSKEKQEIAEIYEVPEGARYLDDHTANFVDAIRKNDPAILNTPISSGSLAAINAQMGNISYRTNSKVEWDADTGKFKDNDPANDLVKASYHNGWKLPVV